MAYDRYDIEYHLTPSGWVSGSEWYFGEKNKDVAPPADRLLTVTKSVNQSSGWSPEEVSWTEHWRAENTDEGIKKLQQKYPLRDFCSSNLVAIEAVGWESEQIKKRYVSFFLSPILNPSE